MIGGRVSPHQECDAESGISVCRVPERPAALSEGAYPTTSTSPNAAGSAAVFPLTGGISLSEALVPELLKWVLINLRFLHHSVCVTESVTVRRSVTSNLSFSHI